MDNVKEYRQAVINLGDEGSELLAKLTAVTLDKVPYVDVIDPKMNGLRVVRPPDLHYVFVHSATGDPAQKDPGKHAASLVDRLVSQAQLVGATPIAFSNNIESVSGDLELLELVANGMNNRAIYHRVACLNGENAVVKGRVAYSANLSGTMISVRHQYKRPLLDGVPKKFKQGNTWYFVFDAKRKPVWINCDTAGTKPEFYERYGNYEVSIKDLQAMNLDDTIKKGARAIVVSGVVETKGKIPFERFEAHIEQCERDAGVPLILQHEDVKDRIVGYAKNSPAFHIGGATVSIIDEAVIKNPPVPRPGDSMLAVRGEPNPRCNGISAWRRLAVEKLGEDYHKTDEGRRLLEYFARPSTVLYPAFRELFDSGLASGFFQNSGGAYDGKLGKPLAKNGLYVKLKDLFQPDSRETELRTFAKTANEDAYGTWPLGNDGFVATNNPEKSKEVLAKYKLESRISGVIEAAQGDKIGVELEGILHSNGGNVRFPEVKK